MDKAKNEYKWTEEHRNGLSVHIDTLNDHGNDFVRHQKAYGMFYHHDVQASCNHHKASISALWLQVIPPTIVVEDGEDIDTSEPERKRLMALGSACAFIYMNWDEIHAWIIDTGYYKKSARNIRQDFLKFKNEVKQVAPDSSADVAELIPPVKLRDEADPEVLPNDSLFKMASDSISALHEAMGDAGLNEARAIQVQTMIEKLYAMSKNDLKIAA